MPTSLDTKDFVAAATEASRRTRFILLLIGTAGIVAFSSIWSTSGTTWLRSRKSINQAMIDYWDCLQRNNCTPRTAADSSRLTFATYWYQQSGYSRADSVDGPKLLALERSYLRPAIFERLYTVQLPFFGVKYDVNDRGWLAGLTFAVLLLWFTLAALNERRAVETALLEAGQIASLESDTPSPDAAPVLHQTFRLLAAHQVFSNPETESLGLLRWLVRASYVLLFVPLLLCLFLAYEDLHTLGIADHMRVPHARLSFGLEIGLLLLVAILTVASVRAARAGDTVWKRCANALDRAHARTLKPL